MNKHWILGILVISAVIAWTLTASAHAPYFEGSDFTAESPFVISDPAVSLAIYSTLSSTWDRDYYVFDINAGQTVLLGITIPQIEGLEEFDPTFTIYGAGMPEYGETIAPVPATDFYEPFSRTSYWDRQDVNYTFPEAGRITVEVYHPAGEVGRYVFTPGTAERGGGDPAFQPKIQQYWTPFEAPTAVPTNPPPPTNTPWPTATAVPTSTPLPEPTPQKSYYCRLYCVR